MKTNIKIKVSLIISTYNWPVALEKCVMSTLGQTHPPDEIIIADDGSGAETRDLIQNFQKTSNIPIIHVWHVDNGFQLGAIRNKAINTAKHEYIIQIDGDIVLEKHFVSDHLGLAELDSFVCGSRVWLSENQSSEILKSEAVPRINMRKFALKTILNGIRSSFLTKILADRYKKNQPTALRGCNMAFWKSDLLKVNGYNEEIQGWGSEDAELAIRLINSGVKKRFIKFAGIAYHLFHVESDKSLLPKNRTILNQSILSKLKWTDHGIIKKK